MSRCPNTGVHWFGRPPRPASALAIFLISLAMGGTLAYDGPFWATTSRAMPAILAGAAMGFINAVGNLGGFVGTYVAGWLKGNIELTTAPTIEQTTQ